MNTELFEHDYQVLTRRASALHAAPTTTPQELQCRLDEASALADDAIGRLRIAEARLREIEERRSAEDQPPSSERPTGDSVEADHGREQALALLAHELRTPLAVILNSVYYLRLAENDPTAIEHVRELITRQAHRMSKLVDDLLDHSRIARNQIQLCLETVDVGVVVSRVAETIRPLIQSRGHELTVTPPLDRIELTADPNRLEQILINLLTNAARYTPPGGKIRLTACREGDEVVMRVRDTGIGIAPEAADRIFEPFTQLNRGAGHASEGLGLGLSVVKALAERHGGAVTCTSAGPGRGCAFTVRLPLTRPDVGHEPTSA
ncbi:MAG: HAMP domain-containing sensor histidine kinase [Paludisphaera borealis]|uniref:sensor histidine kinase n=1 Tax=Paludisphaera borealis TaxID=1387353 RepID=UPI00283B82C2|nr:HAMP domain-containing sensor histidine kinase [Paludisphaera borealis]MDR3619155.1 HAMP domain-containing sensor histidine kinase [Paludisphaera borealis]